MCPFVAVDPLSGALCCRNIFFTEPNDQAIFFDAKSGF